MWCRSDYKSGYLCEFQLYTGKKSGHVERVKESFGIFSDGAVRVNRKKLPKGNQLVSYKYMKKGDILCLEINKVYFAK